MIITIVSIYVIVSILIGMNNVSKLRRQARDLANFPIGDIGYYVFPKQILGIHNWIFLPSWIPYWITVAITAWINR